MQKSNEKRVMSFEELEHLYKLHGSIKKVAKTLGCSQNVIKRLMDLHGIELNPPPEAYSPGVPQDVPPPCSLSGVIKARVHTVVDLDNGTRLSVSQGSMARYRGTLNGKASIVLAGIRGLTDYDDWVKV